jgi:hypothetical protein
VIVTSKINRGAH